MVYNLLSEGVHKKKLALLIDPDKHSESSLLELINRIKSGKYQPHILLVGGSLLFSSIEQTVRILKQNLSIPVVLFPGNSMQVCPEADALLFLSLISGRNADYLIGHHVLAAPAIVQSGIEVISTGYMLINSGQPTSVSYMSGTMPIPQDKTDIALATAMAGQLLGLKALYLEAGSGAQEPINPQTISAIKQNTDIPIIVGGGIRTPQQLNRALKAGADVIVIGSVIEQSPELLHDFVAIVESYY